MLWVIVLAIVLGALGVGGCTSTVPPEPDAGLPVNVGATERVLGIGPDGTPIEVGKLVFLVRNADGSERASADFEVAP